MFRFISPAIESWRVALVGWGGLEFLAQLPTDPVTSNYLQFGALGVLAFAVVGLFREMKESRNNAKNERDSHSQILDRLCERWDKWELSRHSDHEALQTTLRDMTAKCTAVQMGVMGTKGKE